MFLEIWMIVVIIAVFAAGMLHMRNEGYDDGYIVGGAYGTVNVLNIVKERFGDEHAAEIISILRKQSED